VRPRAPYLPKLGRRPPAKLVQAGRNLADAGGTWRSEAAKQAHSRLTAHPCGNPHICSAIECIALPSRKPWRKLILLTTDVRDQLGARRSRCPNSLRRWPLEAIRHSAPRRGRLSPIAASSAAARKPAIINHLVSSCPAPFGEKRIPRNHREIWIQPGGQSAQIARAPLWKKVEFPFS